VKIGTLDCETDPFKYGREPLPFACGLYDGQNYWQTWGDDCVKQMCRILQAYPGSLTLFAHNGGKFDWCYFAHLLEEPLLFIDSRLTRATLFQHEVRDSLKILPVPMSHMQKEEIDYRLMEKAVRERHRWPITSYLKSDCVHLYNAVAGFIGQFGDVLTIGGAAMREIGKRYHIEHLTPEQDALYRPYFHGGRCECYETGVVHARRKLHLYDVNSLYPYVMGAFQHPIGVADHITSKLPESSPFYLAHICARSRGAFPLRTKDGLSFPHGHHEFWVTSHELRAALQLGLVEVTEVIECHVWEETRDFSLFVNHFVDAKIAAELRGDKMGRLFNKFVVNNGYGKWATNPERFKKYKLFDSIAACQADGFDVDGEIGSKIIGAIPATPRKDAYYNVACGASITGAARTVYMKALHCAVRPVYGDTDSLWCEALPMDLHPTKLGAWKEEAWASTLYIARKKLYAAQQGRKFYSDAEKKTPIKCASKGVRMKPEDIARVAKGEVLEVEIEAPSMHIGRPTKFIKRTIAKAKTAA
jgi:Vibrio phage DNA polymerase